MSRQTLRAIDLFAGAGGLTLGLQAAGVATNLAVEREPYRVATFRRHSPEAEVLTEDIRAVSLAHWRDRVDLVCGGPPCQPFSSGGLRRAEADGRDMVPEFVRVVREVQPRAFLMENVPGLTVPPRRDYLMRLIDQMRGLGFEVAWEVLNAADHGVPQNRRRLFVVGLRQGRFVFPTPTHGPGRPLPHVAVADVLPDHPIGEPNPSRAVFARQPDPRPSPYDGHLFNGGGRPIDRSRPCPTILASAGGNKTHFFDDLGLVPAYHRHLLAGGAPRTGALPGARRLTVLESAILQTFPADTVFAGPRSAQYHQVGDAVPPRLAQALGVALQAALMDDSCPGKEPSCRTNWSVVPAVPRVPSSRPPERP